MHSGLIKYLDKFAKLMQFSYHLIDMDAWQMAHGPEFFPTELLSDKEFSEYKNYKSPARQRAWLTGRIAAKRALSQSLGGLNLAFKDLEIHRHPSQAPFFKDFPEYVLSITHSYPVTVAVVSKQAIGIDIEKLIDDGALLAEYFFAAREMQSLTHCDDVYLASVLSTMYWTKKEAIVKLLGIGATIDFKDIDTTEPALKLARYSSHSIATISSVIDNYGLSLAHFGG